MTAAPKKAAAKASAERTKAYATRLEAARQALYDAKANRLGHVLIDARAREYMAVQQLFWASEADGRRVEGNARNASRPRSGKPLTAKIKLLMGRYKKDRTEFKDFLKAWESEALDDLRLNAKGDDYVVSDESGDDAGSYAYTFGTLRTMYSKALI